MFHVSGCWCEWHFIFQLLIDYIYCNALDFHIFFLYLATLLNSLIGSSSASVGLWGSCSFTSFLYIFYFMYACIYLFIVCRPTALARTPSLSLKSSLRRHPFFVPNHKGKTVSLLLLNMMLSEVLTDILYQLGEVPFYLKKYLLRYNTYTISQSCTTIPTSLA